MVTNHYLWGGSYPVGGSGAIAAAIAPLIEAAGGMILYNAEVAEILVANGKAIGVRMADGRELYAERLVSAAGAANTFGRLLPGTVASSHRVERRMRSHLPSVGHLCAYVGLRRTAAELRLPKANFWLYPGNDHDGAVEAFLRDPRSPLPVVYVSFPSAKDPSFADRYPGRSTIELITLAPWDWFGEWAARPVKRRGAEYEALKEGLAARMLERLEPWLPGIREQIDHMEISTPLSTAHYAAYERGEIYGLAHTPQRFRQRFPRVHTPIKNLYLTGQDVVTCGVAGALAAGFLTASAMLGRNLLAAAKD
jgi:all-trans-retinol 13,14-reductase